MTERVDLGGRVAVVTGSSKGWGRGTAEALAAAGANVVVNGLTRPADVDEVVAAVRGRGGEAVGVVADVSTGEGADRLLDAALASFGRLDVWVNSAAVKRLGNLLDLTEAEWDEAVAVQLRGVFLCTQRAARRMVEQGDGGRIVNMAGGTGARGAPRNSSGAAAKGGVLAATASWAKELAPHGITVNAVRGAVATSGNAREREELKRKVAATTGGPAPSDRELGFHQPEEAAQIMVWLASPCSGGVTGRFFGIDGPRLTIWRPARPADTFYCHPHWTAADLEAWVTEPAERRSAEPEAPILPGGYEQLIGTDGDQGSDTGAARPAPAR